MDKKKDVIVWDQFEQTKKDDYNRSKSEESIPTFTRNYESNKRKSAFNVLKKVKSSKPIILTVFSALFIGSVLGFMMLNLLTNLSNGHNSYDQAVKSQTTIKNDQKQSDQEQRQLYTANSMSGYVVQVGVFSKKENAEEWIKNYEQAGFLTTLWKKENQYFLFAGIADTTDLANDFASKVKDHNFDAFVKEWQTKEFEIKLTESEYKWLTSFQNLWEEALYSVSREEGIKVESWEKLIERPFKDPSNIKQFREELEILFDEGLLENGNVEKHKFLLEIWRQYEKYFGQ